MQLSARFLTVARKLSKLRIGGLFLSINTQKHAEIGGKGLTPTTFSASPARSHDVTEYDPQTQCQQHHKQVTTPHGGDVPFVFGAFFTPAAVFGFQFGALH